MPRDLLAERDGIIAEMPILEKSGGSTAQPPKGDLSTSERKRSSNKDKIERDMDKQDAWVEIKPYTTSLGPSDVESCVKLEDATFPLNERATRDKVSSITKPFLCSSVAV